MKSLFSLFNRKQVVVQDPPLANFLFNDVRASWFWLVIRLWLGYQWVEASLHKISDPAWVQTGEAVQGFWARAVAIPEGGKPAISFDWYRSFLTFMLDIEAHQVLGPMIAWGELLIGVALILGIFTGIAAFFGGLLNWNFLMAGTASTNPVLFVLSIGLILAWKVAGHIGVDRYLLPMLGTPWRGLPLKANAPLPAPSQI